MPPRQRPSTQPPVDETPPQGSAIEAALQAAASQQPVAAAPSPEVPVAAKDPHEMPGQRLNTNQVELEPIRKDEQGRIWYQEEVAKPAFAKPRGRRVLTYQETGSKTVTTKSGEYTETFEVAGDQPRQSAQAKITLPSYQVGIYKDPRYPFKIHVYNENRGFDLFEVQAYYGGAELVPAECKRVYVENVLAYDMRTVIRAIQTEFRQLQLMGKV